MLLCKLLQAELRRHLIVSPVSFKGQKSLKRAKSCGSCNLAFRKLSVLDLPACAMVLNRPSSSFLFQTVYCPLKSF